MLKMDRDIELTHGSKIIDIKKILLSAQLQSSKHSEETVTFHQ